ncbi:MAG: YaaR family protein [Firmicutes bacterium]|nr:YaaR family protein [Bacillota bacterium]
MAGSKVIAVKISSVDRPPGGQVSSLVKKPAEKDFSSLMDMAKRENADQYLKEMLEKIIKLGEKIKTTPRLQDIREYKKHITEYLSFILKNYYRVAKDYALYSSSLLIRVNVINKKIDELVTRFLEDQKDNIKLIKQVDEISGLLLDLYN